MTRNAKVGEYIIVNATERLDYWEKCGGMDYLINNNEKQKVVDLDLDGSPWIQIADKREWRINHGDYTLVEDTIRNNTIKIKRPSKANAEGMNWICESFGIEIEDDPERPKLIKELEKNFNIEWIEDTMKAEDIDLTKSAVFDEPLEGFEFRDANDREWHSILEDKLYSIRTKMSEPFTSVDEDGDFTNWIQCRPKPEPKTRPMTNLEVFQLMPIGTVLFADIETDYIVNVWNSNKNDDSWRYTIIDQAFKDLKNLDDIEWMKMEVKE